MKAVYEFDAPESCYMCPFTSPGGNCDSYDCALAMVQGLNKSQNFNWGKARHPDCPLKIVPETPEGELKPCPFCGGEASVMHLTHLGNVYSARCGGYFNENCAAASLAATHRTSADAIAAWNRRA